jgi:hypothetical protein
VQHVAPLDSKLRVADAWRNAEMTGYAAGVQLARQRGCVAVPRRRASPPAADHEKGVARAIAASGGWTQWCCWEKCRIRVLVQSISM